ncbi:MAG: arsinothricin resistance N-acetyltransferase ArsN1 family A [Solirubrobacteraceae bacterium]
MSASAPTVRPGLPGDAGAIAAIYAEGIADRVGTFRTDEPEAGEVLEWLAERGPLLVAEAAGTVVGWTRVMSYDHRCAYDDVGEYTIYVARSARGTGVGAALLAALTGAAKEAGYDKLVGLLFASNGASRALAARCGFREVGVHVRHGRLDGAWKDVVVVERLLGA